MKILPVFLLFSLSFSLQAQPPSRQKLYTAKIITQRDTIMCALYEVTDTTIAVVDINLAKSSIGPSYHDIQVIPVNELIHIKIRRTGAIRRTALTMGVLGAVTGIIVGIATKPTEDYGIGVETFTTGYYAIQGAVIGVAIGGAVGVAIGSASKKFDIKGNQNTYFTHKADLMNYLYKPNP